MHQQTLRVPDSAPQRCWPRRRPRDPPLPAAPVAPTGAGEGQPLRLRPSARHTGRTCGAGVAPTGPRRTGPSDRRCLGPCGPSQSLLTRRPDRHRPGPAAPRDLRTHKPNEGLPPSSPCCIDDAIARPRITRHRMDSAQSASPATSAYGTLTFGRAGSSPGSPPTFIAEVARRSVEQGLHRRASVIPAATEKYPSSSWRLWYVSVHSAVPDGRVIDRECTSTGAFEGGAPPGRTGVPGGSPSWGPPPRRRRVRRGRRRHRCCRHEVPDRFAFSLGRLHRAAQRWPWARISRLSRRARPGRQPFFGAERLGRRWRARSSVEAMLLPATPGEAAPVLAFARDG